MRYTLLLLFSISWPFVSAQDEGIGENLAALAAIDRPTRSIDYRVGPGDLLEISVFGVDSFDQEIRISSSGRISIPFLGKVSVSGMTGEELEGTLTRLITERGLIRDPQVSVFVKEYRSQPIYVLGAVNQPGQYMITQRLNLIDAITMAGGLAPNRADDHALLQRGSLSGRTPNGSELDGQQGSSFTPDPGGSLLKIDLTDLLENGNLALNIPIEGGDVIHVPERKIELFYVVGEVGRAGAYELPDTEEEELRLSQAITWAGGPGKTAKMNKGLLVRYDETGARTELAVNFKDILKGKSPDLPVRPNDVIFIPGSNVKTVGYGFLNIIPGTVSGTVIWRSFR